MRIIVSPFRLALWTLCVICALGLQAHGQDKDKERDNDQANEHPNGIVQDWSHHHAVYPRFGPIQMMIALQQDPRALLSWHAAARREWRRDRMPRHFRDRDHDEQLDRGLKRDWNIRLGNGTTAPAMFPAKFTFDTNATPNCTTDFVVFPVNTLGLSVVAATGTVTSGSMNVTISAGTITPAYVGNVITGAGIPANDTIATITGNPATSLTLAVAATAAGAGEALTVSGQPNIVGFNNLYSGTAGSTGICNAPANGRTAGANDDGVSATTMWSYNVNQNFGSIATSPVLSLDGTKVAFVERGALRDDFHVLAWKSGDGVATNLQTVTSPKTITNGDFVASAPAAGSGTATNMSLGSTNGTSSSPFVDYVSDVAYVANGTFLIRIKDVFCPTTVPVVDPACTSGSPPAPSLDTRWPTVGGLNAFTGVLNTGCPGKLTGPVVDHGTGNVFVGCSDGKLYGFSTTTGVALTNSPLTVGDGTATGGIVDPPMVDIVNGVVYVVSGSSGVPGITGSILVQAKAADLSSRVTVILGLAAQFNLHAPSFNNAYFSSPLSSSWRIYDWATDSLGTITLYGVPFDASHVMTSGVTSLEDPGFPAVELSPTTEFFNGSTDELFVSGMTGPPRNFTEMDITTSPGGFAFSALEGGGTSAIVVDNSSGAAQASSVYFGVLGSNTAVKLTQAGLQ